jgi:hypothetical protein
MHQNEKLPFEEMCLLIRIIAGPTMIANDGGHPWSQKVLQVLSIIIGKNRREIVVSKQPS